jgi:histidinol-phosphate aminotransferase
MDEAYLDFLDDPVDLIPLVRDGMRPNVLLMRTFSKIYGLAGLRLGYGIGCAELVAAIEKIRQPFNINSLAQAAAIAAIDDCGHVRATRENNRRGLQFLETSFRRLGLEHVPSHANFVLARVGDGAGITQALQKSGVIVRPMGGYQLPEWIRISVGTPDENQRCMDALRAILGKT